MIDARSGRVRGAAVRLVPGGGARAAGAGRLDDARRAAAVALHRASSSARPGRCCGWRRRRSAADFYRHARERHLDGFAPLELAEVEAVDALLRIDAPANTDALAGDRSGADRACRRGARRRSGRRGSRGAGAARSGRRRRSRSRPGWPSATTRRSSTGRCSSTGPTRSPPGASCQRRQADADRAAARRTRDPDRGRRHRPDAATSTAAPGSTPTAGATCPAARSSPARTSDSANGHDPLHASRPARAGSTSPASSSTFRDGEVVERPRASAARSYLQAALATDAGARFLGELGIGTNAGIDRADRLTSCSTRRSPAPSTWRSAAPIPETGGRTCRRCTGT